MGRWDGALGDGDLLVIARGMNTAIGRDRYRRRERQQSEAIPWYYREYGGSEQRVGLVTRERETHTERECHSVHISQALYCYSGAASSSITCSRAPVRARNSAHRATRVCVTKKMASRGHKQANLPRQTARTLSATGWHRPASFWPSLHLTGQCARVRFLLLRTSVVALEEVVSGDA